MTSEATSPPICLRCREPVTSEKCPAKCGACRRPFRPRGRKEPKLLPCGHTTCRGCLENAPTTRGRVACPDCAERHEVPEEGVALFPNNLLFYTQKLQGGATVSAGAPPDTPTQCGACGAPFEDLGPREPKLLPCDHTFCLQCIRDLDLHRKRVTCPEATCGKKHPLPEDGVEHFPSNLLFYVWRVQQKQPAEPGPDPDDQPAEVDLVNNLSVLDGSIETQQLQGQSEIPSQQDERDVEKQPEVEPEVDTKSEEPEEEEPSCLCRHFRCMVHLKVMVLLHLVGVVSGLVLVPPTLVVMVLSIALHSFDVARIVVFFLLRSLTGWTCDTCDDDFGRQYSALMDDVHHRFDARCANVLQCFPLCLGCEPVTHVLELVTFVVTFFLTTAVGMALGLATTLALLGPAIIATVAWKMVRWCGCYRPRHAARPPGGSAENETYLTGIEVVETWRGEKRTRRFTVQPRHVTLHAAPPGVRITTCEGQQLAAAATEESPAAPRPAPEEPAPMPAVARGLMVSTHALESVARERTSSRWGVFQCAPIVTQTSASFVCNKRSAQTLCPLHSLQADKNGPAPLSFDTSSCACTTCFLAEYHLPVPRTATFHEKKSFGCCQLTFGCLGCLWGMGPVGGDRVSLLKFLPVPPSQSGVVPEN